MTAGRTVGISEFYVAKPGDSVKTINKQLKRGMNLLLTPGVYDIDSRIEVTREDTVKSPVLLKVGKADIALQVNADNTLIDHT